MIALFNFVLMHKYSILIFRLCSFVFKTAMAQGAGARAIIITESIDEWDEALDNVIEMVDDQ